MDKAFAVLSFLLFGIFATGSFVLWGALLTKADKFERRDYLFLAFYSIGVILFLCIFMKA